jgi:hypothetical protein
MKLNYNALKKKSSLLKSATGLNLSEFEYLKPVFDELWHKFIDYNTFEGHQGYESERSEKIVP